ncbi:MAG: hypothetical protein HY974_00560 [Candidatus Kerfeldbacteria bacterium]|nr:hypothetical protein [Candidatus Kerfeldbacteria bacterium]
MQTSTELKQLSKLVVIPDGQWAVYPENPMTNESIAANPRAEECAEKPTPKGHWPMWSLPSYDDIRTLLQTRQQDPRYKFTVYFKPAGADKFQKWKLNQPKRRAGTKLTRRARQLKRQNASPPSF